MAQRVIFNLPIGLADGGNDLTGLVDVIPAKGETVLLGDLAYNVCKVVHVVHSHSSLHRAKVPVIYLNDSREPTVSERRYRDELSPL